MHPGQHGPRGSGDVWRPLGKRVELDRLDPAGVVRHDPDVVFPAPREERGVEEEV